MKKAFAAAAILVLLAVGVGIVRSDDDSGLALPQLPKPAPPPALGKPTPAPQAADAPAWNEGPQADELGPGAESAPNPNGAPEHLQRQFVKVATTFAQHADEPDVRKALNEMTAKLAERDADSKIRQAEDILKGLIEKFPETPAARRAQQMLEHHLHEDAPAKDAEPIPQKRKEENKFPAVLPQGA